MPPKYDPKTGQYYHTGVRGLLAGLTFTGSTPGQVEYNIRRFRASELGFASPYEQRKLGHIRTERYERYKQGLEDYEFLPRDIAYNRTIGMYGRNEETLSDFLVLIGARDADDWWPPGETPDWAAS